MRLTEDQFVAEFRQLKSRSGGHCPGVADVGRLLGRPVEVDGCFPGNPYATDVFLDRFTRELGHKNWLRDLVERYPSANASIARTLAPQLGTPSASVFVANGATEAIQAVLSTYAAGRTLVQVPTFSPYYEFAQQKDCRVS